jgi:hypothetical protein
MATQESERRQDLSKSELKDLVKIINSALFCEFLVYFKIYKLCNGTLKKLTDPMLYESLRHYERIEWIRETHSGKIKCLLNLGSCIAYLSLWIDYNGDLFPKCKVILCDSRKELINTYFSIAMYCKYLRETEEYIEVVVVNELF